MLEERVATIDQQVASGERRITALEEATALSASAARLVRASSSGSSADTLAALQVGVQGCCWRPSDRRVGSVRPASVAVRCSGVVWLLSSSLGRLPAG